MRTAGSEKQGTENQESGSREEPHTIRSADRNNDRKSNLFCFESATDFCRRIRREKIDDLVRGFFCEVDNDLTAFIAETAFFFRRHFVPVLVTWFWNGYHGEAVLVIGCRPALVSILPIKQFLPDVTTGKVQPAAGGKQKAVSSRRSAEYFRNDS
jgi:hypothetical protein